MKSKLNKIALATLCLGLAFFISCSDLPDINEEGATSSSSGTGGSPSSPSTGGNSSSAGGSGAKSSSSGSKPQQPTGGIWNGTADTTWYSGTKIEFSISTAEHLAGLALLVNKGNYMSGKTINLTANIILNDTKDWQNWEDNAPDNSWTPIKNFQGKFDGNGHVISGAYYSNTDSINIGLFGTVNGKAAIKNLGIEASYFSGKDRIGGIVGSNIGGTDVTISNSYSKGIVKTITPSGSAGGLVGRLSGGKISDCYSTSTVIGINTTYSNIGGLAGSAGTSNRDIINIINSYSTGKVLGTGQYKSREGGLVGDLYFPNSTTNVANSYYDTNTSGQNDNTGKGEPKTTEEMQSEAFAELLGDAFKYKAGSYPLLKWQ